MREMAKINDGASIDADDVRNDADQARTPVATEYAEKTAGRLRKEDLEQIISYINDIRYGSVTVVIQDGHVLQIEKNEKIRIR
jgi:hypothetical protein